MVAVVPVVALNGCASTPLDDAQPPPPNIASYRPAGDGGNGALLDAVVAESEPCITVEAESGERWVPVFAVGDVTGEGEELRYDGMPLTVGAHVELPGGAVDAPPDDELVPDGCAGNWWLVNVAN